MKRSDSVVVDMDYSLGRRIARNQALPSDCSAHMNSILASIIMADKQPVASKITFLLASPDVRRNGMQKAVARVFPIFPATTPYWTLRCSGMLGMIRFLS